MIRFSLRVPDELHAWLVERADREHRSLNAEIVHLLEVVRTESERDDESP
jgi:predicted HicB family RNase H-like nuclease